MLSNAASTSQPSPARAATSVLLANGVSRLETTLKLTTAILALAAGVYTYLGVRELLNGSPTTIFFAAVIYSVAVSVGIYAFWVFMMQFMPHVVSTGGRGLMFGCMLLGSFMIVAMSLLETVVYCDVRLASCTVVSVNFRFTVAAWQSSKPTA